MAINTFSGGNPINSLQAAGKNAIINGGLDIWQRGTSFTASGIYTADRWFNGSNTAQTFTRQTTNDTTNLPTIQYCIRAQRDSGTTNTNIVGISQSIETSNSIRFAGQAVTLSFYARKGANLSGTVTATIYSGTGTDQRRDFGAGFTGEATVVTSSPSLTTSWVRYSITGTVATTATELAALIYFVPTGTAGAADYIEITGVQLELGTTATTFSRAGGTIQGELAACQRYYYRNAGGNVYSHIGFGTGINTTQVAYEQKLPVTMRVTPTSIEYSNVAVNLPGSGTTGVTGLVITGAESSPDIVTLQATVASGLTAYRPYFLINNNNAAGYVGYVAEL